MGTHHHHHGHGHHHHHHGGGNILVAFFLNAGFAVIELIGGYLTNSMAIYSDALHDLGDSIALLFAYFSEKLSHKDADENFTFGYRRFSLLAALVNGIILLVGSLYVIYEAILRIANPAPVEPKGMIALAILGVGVNLFAAYRLSKDDGMNQKMVMYHLLEDVLGWVAVLIVSIVLLFKPLYILDSILSILISIVILSGVYKNVLKVGEMFLQKFPQNLDMEKVVEEVKSIELVDDVHAVRGWSMDESASYLSFHVTVPSETRVSELEVIKAKVKEILKSHSVHISTIEFEAAGNNCCP